MNEPKPYKLTGADGNVFESLTKGLLGGNSADKIYGRLDCGSANRALPSYGDVRVFFADEETAIKNRYRPCGNCMHERYNQWKAGGVPGTAEYPWLEPPDHGPVYTPGASFRARAEARQREVRAQTLGAGWKRYGHFLDETATGEGRNFVIPEAWEEARKRAKEGKGVAARTFENMLSSQAMCFNLFTPLVHDHDLATRLLAPRVPGLQRVRSIKIEHTPPPDVFKDQSGLGGVDCDVLIVADFSDGQLGVIAVETKFVEPEFSGCGFHKSCTVTVRDDTSACLYESKKGYLYWRRTLEHETISLEKLPAQGCPFHGSLWQLWVNHALAHVEARCRDGKHARYAVCAPSGNKELLRGGSVLEDFKALTRDPSTVLFFDLDSLLKDAADAARDDQSLEAWARGLQERYAGI